MKLAAVLLCVSMSAYAEFKDGNALLSDITSPEPYARGVALGYVMGIADMGQGFVHCGPPNVTAGQINDMVKNYLTNTPAERHYTADVVVNKVLKTVWPCKRDKAT